MAVPGCRVGEYRDAAGGAGEALVDEDPFTRHGPTHSGQTIIHYPCDIVRSSDGKPVATVTSTVMLLRGGRAAGR